MTYEFACGDVMPGCPKIFTADAEDGLLQQVGAHARSEHGIEEVTADVRDAVLAAARGR